jgi:hypothetical protein
MTTTPLNGQGPIPDTPKNKATTTSLKDDPGALPGFLPRPEPGALNFDNYAVRYQKLDLDELADVTELEKIETKAIRNQGIFVLSKKDFTFMDRIFVIISYLEENSANENK